MMGKSFIIGMSALLLLGSCDTYTGTGAYMGSTLGSIFGSAIGGIAGGPHGSDVGTIVGMVGGAVAGAAIGQATDQKQQAQRSAIAADRKAQVGTGDRSERIRTYNFPQGRVTDHRIGLTLYKIDAIMNGDLDELIDALITADRAEKLRQAEDGSRN